jgi:hypothetical protein
MFKFISSFFTLALLIGPFNAKATTINFATALTAGNKGQSVAVSGVTASAWMVSKIDGTSWSSTGVILNNRNEGPSELGLGVCFSSNCPATGNGNINEIDNNGSTFDVIQLDFGAATLVNSIGLSSLDSGLKDGFTIFGSGSALPNLSLLTPLVQGTNQSAGSVEPIIPIDQTFRYFFVTSMNRGTSSTGSDFLLEGVTTTPEPYTSAMLGLGLLAISGALRLKTSQGRARQSK